MSRLWEFLDGELEVAEAGAVRKHLEVCRRCYPKFDFQKAWFEHVRRASRPIEMSDDTRRRLFQSILEQEAEDG